MNGISLPGLPRYARITINLWWGRPKKVAA